MRKLFIALLGCILLVPAFLQAKEVVVLEFFTATWCPPCATAAAGAVTLHEDHPDELLIVKYHCNDEFSNSAANGRISYYHDGSFDIPEATFDGTIVLSGSGGVSQYESTFLTCKATQSPITLELTRPTTAYNSTSGSLQAVITNTSDESVSGTVLFTITESDIPYEWQNRSELHSVARDLPGGFWGTEINLASGENTTISHDFTIDENWPYFTEDENCEFGCFVQGNDKEIYEGAVLPFGDPTGGVEESLVEVISCEIPSFLQDGNLELSVEKNTEVEISLYGTTGRNIETIFTGSLSTGKHRLEVDTHSLTQGIYFLAIEASGLVQTKKLVVLE